MSEHISGQVLFFGKLCDASGISEARLPAQWAGMSVAEARIDAASLWPGLETALNGPGIRIAVNQEIVLDENTFRLSGDEEIAFMPPLSG